MLNDVGLRRVGGEADVQLVGGVGQAAGGFQQAGALVQQRGAGLVALDRVAPDLERGAQFAPRLELQAEIGGGWVEVWLDQQRVAIGVNSSFAVA